MWRDRGPGRRWPVLSWTRCRRPRMAIQIWPDATTQRCLVIPIRGQRPAAWHGASLVGDAGSHLPVVSHGLPRVPFRGPAPQWVRLWGPGVAPSAPWKERPRGERCRLLWSGVESSVTAASRGQLCPPQPPAVFGTETWQRRGFRGGVGSRGTQAPVLFLAVLNIRGVPRLPCASFPVAGPVPAGM